MNEFDELLKVLRHQEDDIQFASFSNDRALEVGLALVRAAREKGKAVTVDITRAGQQLFHFAMAGTSIDNGEWVKRKNRVVNRFGHSSYYMGIMLKNAGQTIEEKYLLPESEYAPHGGAFPLIIKGVGVVGTVTVSGQHQEEDQELVVGLLREFLVSGTK